MTSRAKTNHDHWNPQRPIVKKQDTELVTTEATVYTVCPAWEDRRFVPDPNANGAGFMAEWKKLRGRARK